MSPFIPCPWCVDGRDAQGFYCGNCGGAAVVIEGSPDEACHHQFAFAETLGRCLRMTRTEKIALDAAVVATALALVARLSR